MAISVSLAAMLIALFVAKVSGLECLLRSSFFKSKLKKYLMTNLVFGSLEMGSSVNGNWSNRYSFFLELVPDVAVNLGPEVVQDGDADVDELVTGRDSNTPGDSLFWRSSPSTSPPGGGSALAMAKQGKYLK